MVSTIISVMFNFSKIASYIIVLVLLSGCSGNFFKRSDVKDNPVNVEDRVRKNIEEGRGIRFGKFGKKGVSLILLLQMNCGGPQLKF